MLIKSILEAALAAMLITGCSSPPAPIASTSTALPAQPTSTLPVPTATAQPTSTSTPSATDTPAPSPTPSPAVLVGAGDIAYCGSEPPYDGDEKTAGLVLSMLAENPDATVFISGDTAYGDGTMAEFQKCFEPSWGQFKERIRPAPGNHDYHTDQGGPYYTYFGAAAGEAGLGYYSYDLGEWHIVALNSNCNDVACGPESRQVQWLREDLQNSQKQCTLMYWHHPRFSSGLAGNYGSVASFWQTAYEMGVDVVVNGHDHNYERFAPMDAEGNANDNGVREFVVGTGGAVLRDMGVEKPNSEVRYNGTHGVIRFRLYPGRYEWQFIPTADAAQTDNGAGACH